MTARDFWQEQQVNLLGDLYEENAPVLEEETTNTNTKKKKSDVRKMMAQRVSALEGPNWGPDAVASKIK